MHVDPKGLRCRRPKKGSGVNATKGFFMQRTVPPMFMFKERRSGLELVLKINKHTLRLGRYVMPHHKKLSSNMFF